MPDQTYFSSLASMMVTGYLRGWAAEPKDIKLVGQTVQRRSALLVARQSRFQGKAKGDQKPSKFRGKPFSYMIEATAARRVIGDKRDLMARMRSTTFAVSAHLRHRAHHAAPVSERVGREFRGLQRSVLAIISPPARRRRTSIVQGTQVRTPLDCVSVCGQ